jgi:glutathione S-transferase
MIEPCIAGTPSGRIPAILDTDTGISIFESGAILLYPAKTGAILLYPAKISCRLRPTCPWAPTIPCLAEA